MQVPSMIGSVVHALVFGLGPSIPPAHSTRPAWLALHSGHPSQLRRCGSNDRLRLSLLGRMRRDAQRVEAGSELALSAAAMWRAGQPWAQGESAAAQGLPQKAHRAGHPNLWTDSSAGGCPRPPGARLQQLVHQAVPRHG